MRKREQCLCGDDRADHWRGVGSCLSALNPRCACDEYVARVQRVPRRLSSALWDALLRRPAGARSQGRFR